MNPAQELAALYQRDLTRLLQEVRAFPDSTIFWKTAAGVRNSAGNLVLHLEGNLREYIGRQLGGVAYIRHRDQEFSQTGPTPAEIAIRVESLQQLIPGIIEALSETDLARNFPEELFGKPLSTLQYLVHSHGHFNYHLGQIDYLRRILTGGDSVAFAQI